MNFQQLRFYFTDLGQSERAFPGPAGTSNHPALFVTADQDG